MVDMASQTLDRIHGLRMRRAVFERNGGQVLVKIPLQLCGVVSSAVMIDGERGVAVSADNKKLRAEESTDEASIIFEHTHELGACMILHWALPQVVRFLVKEKRGAGVTIQVRAKTPSEVEAGTHTWRSGLAVRRPANTGDT
jgi:hypothetical protein